MGADTDPEVTDSEDNQRVDERVQDLYENEPLYKVFPMSSAKILMALIDSAFDMTMSQIADSAEVSRATAYDKIETLQEVGLVEVSREEGGSTYYQLTDGEKRESLVQLYDALRLSGESDEQ